MLLWLGVHRWRLGYDHKRTPVPGTDEIDEGKVVETVLLQMLFRCRYRHRAQAESLVSWVLV